MIVGLLVDLRVGQVRHSVRASAAGVDDVAGDELPMQRQAARRQWRRR